ncbi:sigma-70 family RNA polymerase sigma factor [Leisingera thetidis]|uniref:sigma-70 family RNA polymerase sigma factor n=1 Tax=Leisingera thetidis TaxID=2930199 RepID=UPI0021F6AA4B|nr:sigma-70 family RNA polymerase sigma factor [Leisingera thetidis]
MPNHSPLPVCEVLIRELISRRKLHLCEALRIVGRPDAAEDILQNTAVKCLTCPPRHQPENPGCYVSRMVRNASIDYLRKHAKEIATAFDGEDQIASAGTTPLCGLTHLERKQELAAVARALSGLSERKREVFLRHRLADVPQKKIAEEMEVSRALVNVMIKQAESHCARALAGEDDGRALALNA